jgi:hypothetical protein
VRHCCPIIGLGGGPVDRGVYGGGCADDVDDVEHVDVDINAY